MGCYWTGPRCIYYDGKRGHYGEKRHKCKHKDRKSLNGWWGRLIGCDNCVMTPYDDDNYCALFKRKEYPRPPGPPPGPASAEMQDVPGRMRMMAKKNPFTEDERKIMDLLVDAHKLFLSLPVTHSSHSHDWAEGIHRCQDVLIHRIVQRDYPDQFVTIPGRTANGQ